MEQKKVSSALLTANKARKISRVFDRIHICVDASFEPEGSTGIGGLCLSSFGKVLGFFSGQIPDELLDLLREEDQETAIFELELVAVVICLLSVEGGPVNSQVSPSFHSQ